MVSCLAAFVREIDADRIDVSRPRSKSKKTSGTIQI
jgi:hypothetical protein